MHPTELLGAGDWEYYARGGGMMPGIRWLSASPTTSGAPLG